MKEQIKKYTNIDKTWRKKLNQVEDILKSNESNAVKVDLINNILSDITDKLIDIHHQALTDEMTGFVNRHFLNEFLKKTMRISLRYGYSMSLAIMDIDYFKSVNDIFGHNAGDKVIKVIAEIIKKDIRNSDVVSRYGGDEFIIVFPTTKLTDAQRVMERIKLAVYKYDFGDGIKSSISYGLADLQGKHKLFEDLIKDADDKLYKAKEKRIDPNKSVRKTSSLKKIISKTKK